MTVPVPVARGLIYDRKGRPLVENVPTFVVKSQTGGVALRSASGRQRLAVAPA